MYGRGTVACPGQDKDGGTLCQNVTQVRELLKKRVVSF